MAVVRVLSPYVARVIMTNPLHVKAIAQADLKTDKIDAGVLASLHAASFLPEVWLPDAESERRRLGTAQPDRPSPHPSEERDPQNSDGASAPAVPARRTVQRAGAGVTRASGPPRWAGPSRSADARCAGDGWHQEDGPLGGAHRARRGRCLSRASLGDRGWSGQPTSLRRPYAWSLHRQCETGFRSLLG